MDDPSKAPWGSVDTEFEVIHGLARDRDVDGVRKELARGVDVDILNEKHPNGDGGNTALWFAAQGPWPNGLAVVKVLVESGAKVNRQCEHGRTALHIASWWGHVDVVKYLLEHGADPNIATPFEGTPADIARRENRKELIEYFESIGL